MAHFLLRQQPTDERLKFSSKAVEDLKKKIFDIASPIIGPEPPRVLFIGESGAGKSSFISSILSTFSGTITMVSTIGSRVGYEFNNSRRFFEYRIHEKDEAGRKLNLVLCDSRGISKEGQLGISKREIPLLIEGRFRHNDKIHEDSDPTNDTVIAQREPLEPCSIVFLEKAVRIGDVHDSIKDKLNLARDLIREKGIPSCLVITHIDEVEPKLKNVLGSKKIEKLIKERAGETGVTTNRVFVVKNYTDERRTHVKHDVLILRTLLGIVSDVNQRLRDKRNDIPLTPTITRPKPAPRRIRRSTESTDIGQSNKRDRPRTSQNSGSYATVGQSNESIRTSPLKSKGNTSEKQNKEFIRHAQINSSNEEEKPKYTPPIEWDMQLCSEETTRTKSEMRKSLSMTFHMPDEDC